MNSDQQDAERWRLLCELRAYVVSMGPLDTIHTGLEVSDVGDLHDEIERAAQKGAAAMNHLTQLADEWDKELHQHLSMCSAGPRMAGNAMADTLRRLGSGKGLSDERIVDLFVEWSGDDPEGYEWAIAPSRAVAAEATAPLKAEIEQLKAQRDELAHLLGSILDCYATSLSLKMCSTISAALAKLEGK